MLHSKAEVEVRWGRQHKVTVSVHTPKRTHPNKSLPVDPEHVVEYFIEQDQGNIKFFFIEDLQPSLDIVP